MKSYIYNIITYNGSDVFCCIESEKTDSEYYLCGYAKSGVPISRTIIETYPYEPCVSSSGKFAAFTTLDKKIGYLYDLTSGLCLWQKRFSGVQYLRFNNNDTLILYDQRARLTIDHFGESDSLPIKMRVLFEDSKHRYIIEQQMQDDGCLVHDLTLNRKHSIRATGLSFFSPAIVHDYLILTESGGELRCYSLPDFKLLYSKKPPNDWHYADVAINAAQKSFSVNFVNYKTGSESILFKYRLDNGVLINEYKLDIAPNACAFLSNGNAFASGTREIFILGDVLSIIAF